MPGVAFRRKAMGGKAVDSGKAAICCRIKLEVRSNKATDKPVALNV